MVTILAVTILVVWLAYSPDQWKTKLVAGLDFLNNKPNLISFPMVHIIGRLSKMAAILSTIGKLNTIEKLNTPLPLEFKMFSLFQPPPYSFNQLVD